MQRLNVAHRTNAGQVETNELHEDQFTEQPTADAMIDATAALIRAQSAPTANPRPGPGSLTKVAIGVLLMVASIVGSSALRSEAAGPATIAIVDQRGSTFSLAALPQRFVAVTFVASRCTDACPIANALFAKLQKRITRSGRSLALVTLTLDPSFDTPFAMSTLAAAFNADPAVWRLASGKPANIRGLMHAFGVAVAPDKKGIPDEHSCAVYILDGQRKLRTILLLSTSLPDDVFAATR